MDNCRIETLIIGASFYGMALLKTLGKNAMLVERGYRIGAEFSSSLRVSGFDGEVKTELGKSFLRRMTEHKLLDGSGAIYSTPAAYLLADMSVGANALFATEVPSIEKENGTYKLELFNCEGRCTVFADRIVDTTAEGAVRAGVGTKKRLNVILTEPTTETEYDSFTGGNIFGFPAGLSETLPETRSRLYELLESENMGAVFVADIFDYKIEKTVYKKDDNYYIIPSLGFGNPISAVDEGGGHSYGF